MKDTSGNESATVAARGGVFGRHLGRCVTVLGILTAMIVGSTGVAMAAATGGAATAALFKAEKCQENASYKICFPIEERTPDHFDIIVRLAVFMSQADAQKFVDARPDSGMISCSLFGADFTTDEFLSGPGTAGASTLQAQQRGLFLEFFFRNVPGGELDEDFVGDDEIVAKVSINLPSLGFDHRTFRTPEISHSF